MTDVFETYAKAAHSRVSQPQKLVGVIATRAAARLRYSEIVEEMNACEDSDQLEAFLVSIDKELIQFRTELEFYWEGDGEEFPGLCEEIERTRDCVRFNDGLDSPGF